MDQLLDLPRKMNDVPLRCVEGGAARVGTSRVTLDLLVEEYESGSTPEDIVRAYDSLSLPDVYAVITYYLQNRDEVRAYLARRETEADRLQIEIEAGHPTVSREELNSRRRAGGHDRAAPGQ